MKGQVIKALSGVFDVLVDGEVVSCTGRGRLRTLGDIYVGDYVEISLYKQGKGAIEKVLPRKNKLTRPYVTNIDEIVICIAPLPKPDYFLVDKLLINCLKQDITPILCVNKTDIMDNDFREQVLANYKDLAEIVFVSSLTGDGIDKLLSLISGKYVSMAGQSAVGKSSIINAIVGEKLLETGELSRKIERGRHTTRAVEIYDIGHGIRLADTCGFSVLELGEFDPSELASYYTDFDEYRVDCKYRGCRHINEPNCAVRQAVEQGKLSKDRYQRYLALYNELNEKWRKRYE